MFSTARIRIDLKEANHHLETAGELPKPAEIGRVNERATLPRSHVLNWLRPISLLIYECLFVCESGHPRVGMLRADRPGNALFRPPQGYRRSCRLSLGLTFVSAVS